MTFEKRLPPARFKKQTVRQFVDGSNFMVPGLAFRFGLECLAINASWRMRRKSSANNTT